MDKYINMILLQLSDKYKVNYMEIRKYENRIKYSSYQVKLYNYIPEKDKYKSKKTIEAKNKMELIYKLKELI